MLFIYFIFYFYYSYDKRNINLNLSTGKNLVPKPPRKGAQAGQKT